MNSLYSCQCDPNAVKWNRGSSSTVYNGTMNLLFSPGPKDTIVSSLSIF